MARFHGKIGFVKTEETAPGVHTEVTTEMSYVGDILRSTQNWERGENLNDNLNINNRFSIVADAFAFENLQFIRYINWMGSKWKVSTIDIQRPRLILVVGGLYNG